jgi:hypothetical protein
MGGHMSNVAKTSVHFRSTLFFTVLSVLIGFVPIICVAENWVLLRSGQGNYYYDKDSLITIEKGIKEVWDASHNGYSLNGLPKKSKRQVRIDCARHKFALGETVAWVGENEVAHFYWNKNGWVWSDTRGKLNPKLFKAVCATK